MGETINFLLGSAEADRALGLQFGIGMLAVLGGLYLWCWIVDGICKSRR